MLAVSSQYPVCADPDPRCWWPGLTVPCSNQTCCPSAFPMCGRDGCCYAQATTTTTTTTLPFDARTASGVIHARNGYGSSYSGYNDALITLSVIPSLREVRFAVKGLPPFGYYFTWQDYPLFGGATLVQCNRLRCPFRLPIGGLSDVDFFWPTRIPPGTTVHGTLRDLSVMDLGLAITLEIDFGTAACGYVDQSCFPSYPPSPRCAWADPRCVDVGPNCRLDGDASCCQGFSLSASCCDNREANCTVEVPAASP
jgi:hypothetical protein